MPHQRRGQLRRSHGCLPRPDALRLGFIRRPEGFQGAGRGDGGGGSHDGYKGHAHLLPLHPAVHLRASRAERVEGVQLRHRGDSRDRREAVWARSDVVQGAHCIARGGSRRGEHLPHRPLPRQRAHREHHRPALQQHHIPAPLVQGVHSQRADLLLGELRHGGPRRVFRQLRHHPRRHAEPPTTGDGAVRHGGARESERRGYPRREGQGDSMHPPHRDGQRGARSVQGPERRGQNAPRVPRRRDRAAR